MDQLNHQRRIEDLQRVILAHEPPLGQAHGCAYLHEQSARELAFFIYELEPGVYHALMDLNFRRSGRVVYRPACEGCAECRALRVPTESFRPDRSQRRCTRRNRDLTIEITEPEPTAEKHALYRRYLGLRHDRQMSDDYDSFREFLYDSPLNTREVIFRLDDRMVAVGILDVEPRALSTVYCYYDPADLARSPGTFNVLWTLELARRENIPYVYLGYYVGPCPKMNYKLNFRPCELLRPDGTWEPVSRA